MSAKIIDGKAVAERIRNEIRDVLEKEAGLEAHLAAVQVGEDPSSRIYIQNQKKTCEEIGIAYTLHELPDDTTDEDLGKFLDRLNAEESVNGIILQLPLPDGLDTTLAQDRIAPEKDVEGVSAGNLGRLFAGREALVPCTALAAYECFLEAGMEPKGTEAVIIGRSVIVGKPLGLLLMSNHATVTTCHTRTRDISAHTKRADAVFVAAGVPGVLTGDMIRPGAVVIDVGINRVPMLDDEGNPVLNKNGKPRKKTVGDADFDSVKEVAGAVTPVPGGAGAVTTAILLKNTVQAALGKQ